MVIAPASTGRERINKIVVTVTDQQNRGIISCSKEVGFILYKVARKLMDPMMDLIPAMCKEKIVKSIEIPLWLRLEVRGGYRVHPAPVPVSAIILLRRRNREGGRSQNLMLFMRGKARSGAPVINGRSQLPNPPSIIGITKKKIIIKAWAVMMEL